MKRFVSILLVLAMVMALAPMTVLADVETTTINVVAAEYSNNSASWWSDFEALYEQENPTVDLIVDVVSWNDIYTEIYNRVENNNAPDILNMDSYEDFWANDQLLPVKSYMSDSTYAKFYPELLNQSKKDGTVWAVPDLTSTRALYYNKDILNAAGASVPTNWGEVYATIGVYLAHSLVYYYDLYACKHVLLLGRVMSGKGGDLILDLCKRVLADEYPELSDKIFPSLPDEKFRRVGQSMAAASLPEKL